MAKKIDGRSNNMATREKIPEEMRKKIWESFKGFQTISLATAEGDRPRVRPITMGYLDSRFWILTGTADAKIEQIRDNPKIEFSLPLKRGEHEGYVRGAGTANIIESKELKDSIARRCDYFSMYWKGLDDPNYTLLEIVMEEIEYMAPDGETVYALKYRL